MPPQRQECLNSMYMNIGVHIQMLYWKDWYNMILPDHPLHEGFRYLSCIHKADYLRCYFMHHFGGGYSDIKYYTPNNNWNLCFDIMDAVPQVEVIGQPEVMEGSPITEFNGRWQLPKLISNCYFICRPRSNFTTTWYNRLMQKMDEFLPELRRHPATDIFGRENGYPVPWASLLGVIVHSTVMEFRETHKEAVIGALQTGCDMTHKWGGIFG